MTLQKSELTSQECKITSWKCEMTLQESEVTSQECKTTS